ncbi:uncharacterized protein LOC130998464 [Salvia miltiorrhiza]|uniref:uncharacterized protein LOC130998464 n=1 Tax=Salvia miltiorrhiza TaxID=226208 RepID=UPI0025AC207E|nr:uncharacterized protein LOC130998464 [Salvia miltiorrhiza]
MSSRDLFSSHLLYADDVLLFCRATARNSIAIDSILDIYGSVSGKAFATCLMGIKDHIMGNFTRWKGHHLSMAGRMCLVSSVVHSAATHSMLVYRWPTRQLNELDKACRNFIWTGDARRSHSSVSWTKVCKPKFAGLHPRSRWASSTVWKGVRSTIETLRDDSFCSMGNVSSVLYWLDNWMGYKIMDHLKFPAYIHPYLMHTVVDYLVEGVWHLTMGFTEPYPEIAYDIITTPISQSIDSRAWVHNDFGLVTATSARRHLLASDNLVDWGSWIWASHIPVRHTLVLWR